MIGTDFEGQIFVVNRLSTPSSAELERQLWATNWLWYWKNENGGWMNYSDTVRMIKTITHCLSTENNMQSFEC
jgi:hypothetical protein